MVDRKNLLEDQVNVAQQQNPIVDCNHPNVEEPKPAWMALAGVGAIHNTI